MCGNRKIYIDDFPDSSYIKLSDGTLTLPVLEARSTQPEGSGNTFGQKQIDFDHIEYLMKHSFTFFDICLALYIYTISHFSV